jgi:hypothetical protein
MMSNKADATHQAMTDMISWPVQEKADATREGMSRQNLMTRTGEANDTRQARYKERGLIRVVGPYIYKKRREKYFVPNALSRSNSRCTTINFRILTQLHAGLSYKG